MNALSGANIKSLLKEKSAPSDFSGFQLHRKINGFFSFDAKTLTALKRGLDLNISVEELKKLGKALGKNVPTVLALKILDAYWNSPRSHFTREIGEINVISENPHIRKALTKYEELHRRFTPGAYRTLADIQIVNVKAVAADNRDSVLMNAGRVSEECAIYDKNRRVRYFSYLMTKWDDDFLRAERRAAMECSVAGAIPKLFIHEEPGGNTPERTVAFARYADSLDAAAYDFGSSCVGVEKPLTKATVLGFSTFPQIGSGNPEPGDIIAYFETRDTERDGILKLNAFLREINVGDLIQRGVYCDNGLLNGIIALGSGFDIELGEASEFGMPGEELILEKSLNRIVIVIKRGKLAPVKAAAEKYSFELRLLGKFNARHKFRLISKGAELINLSMNVLLRRRHSFSRYVLESVPEPFLDRASESAEDIKNSVMNVSEGIVLNALGGGRSVAGQMSGSAQTTPNFVAAVKPDFCGYGNAVNTAALSSPATGGDLFTKAVNTALNAVLKLVVSGVSIYDIVLNPTYLVPDTDRSKGMLLELALGVFYLENALSLCSLGYSVGKGETHGGIPSLFMAATGITTTDSLKNGLFRNGNKIYKIVIPRDEYGIPDFKFVLKLAAQISINVTKGNLIAARLIENGVAKTVVEGTSGERLGFSFSSKPPESGINRSEMLIAVEDAEEFSAFDPEYIGVVDDTGRIRSTAFNITHSELDRLVSRYPFENRPDQRYPVAPVSQKGSPLRSGKVRMPILTIVHCDYASEGAVAESAGRRNFKIESVYVGKYTEEDQQLLRTVREKIASSDMLALVGKSAYGGYADGGKFYKLLMKPVVTDAMNELIYRNDGLILATGEGSRALAHIGLLSKGSTEHAHDAGLRLEAAPDHAPSAKIPRIRIANRFSPMLTKTGLGYSYFAAAAGKDMRLRIQPEIFKELTSSGQVAAQFVDPVGMPTSAYPFNPDASDFAVAALSSPDGRVLGFFALPEKAKYIAGERSLTEDIFDSVAEYFGSADSE